MQGGISDNLVFIFQVHRQQGQYLLVIDMVHPIIDHIFILDILFQKPGVFFWSFLKQLNQTLPILFSEKPEHHPFTVFQGDKFAVGDVLDHCSPLAIFMDTKITDPKHLSRKLRERGPSTPRMEPVEPGNPELGGYPNNY
jgi:hypothetical protein